MVATFSDVITPLLLSEVTLPEHHPRGEDSTESLSEEEAEATTASGRRIKALRPDRVYFSHDPRIWTPHGIVDPT